MGCSGNGVGEAQLKVHGVKNDCVRYHVEDHRKVLPDFVNWYKIWRSPPIAIDQTWRCRNHDWRLNWQLTS